MSKYKVGDKFIIEIEEIYNGNLCKYEDHMHLHRVKGFNSLVLDEYGLDKLAKHDALQERLELIDELKRDEYKKGLNDAWELARKLYDMKCEELGKIFCISDSFYEIIRGYTPQEALAKMKAYEDSKIEVGDVVECGEHKFAVCYKADDYVSGMNYKGKFYCDCIKDCKKTGKHIDIKSFLEQIGE